MANSNFFGGAFFGGGFFGGEGGSVAPPIIGGGIPHDTHRTKQDISKDRKRLGLEDEEYLKAQQVIQDVAKRQAERLELDKQKQFEELSRELKLNKLEWEGQYLDSLNETRERLITLEIGVRLKARIQEESDLIMLMLLAANI